MKNLLQEGLGKHQRTLRMEGIAVLKGKWEPYTIRGPRKSQGKRRIKISLAGIFYYFINVSTYSLYTGAGNVVIRWVK